MTLSKFRNTNMKQYCMYSSFSLARCSIVRLSFVLNGKVVLVLVISRVQSFQLYFLKLANFCYTKLLYILFMTVGLLVKHKNTYAYIGFVIRIALSLCNLLVRTLLY